MKSFDDNQQNNLSKSEIFYSFKIDENGDNIIEYTVNWIQTNTISINWHIICVEAAITTPKRLSTNWSVLKISDQDLTDDCSSLIQIMAWCRQAWAIFDSDLFAHVTASAHNRLIYFVQHIINN